MTDLKPLTNSMVTSMMGGMVRYLLRNVLQRELTVWEILYCECELWLWGLLRWYQERLNTYQVIHDLIWGLDE